MIRAAKVSAQPVAIASETGYLRLPQIIGDPNAEPPIPAVIPVGKSTWWSGVKSGRFPKPVKLGPRITAWRVEDVRRLIERGQIVRTVTENSRTLKFSSHGFEQE